MKFRRNPEEVEAIFNAKENIYHVQHPDNPGLVDWEKEKFEATYTLVKRKQSAPPVQVLTKKERKPTGETTPPETMLRKAHEN